MKQRFSSLDVKAIAHELHESLVTLRLSNVYDLSSKILLLKFAKPENKKQLVIDSGFRCHLTDFTRATAAVPSAFVARLRKFLKTRRVTAVSQIGTDRIIEFQFSDGKFRLYLEFFASGNVILTDGELKIITLLRNVAEGEGQEPQRVGLQYSLENRQNYGGVPQFTRERLRSALEVADKKAASTAALPGGKKARKKAADELRRGLATTLNELPPVLIDHAFRSADFDASARPADVLQDDQLFNGLFKSLEQARSIVDGIAKTPTCPGYIFAKRRDGADAADRTVVVAQETPKNLLLYEDFHPFLPRQYEDDPVFTVLAYDSFNKTADEFFSSLEGQKLESRLIEHEATAKRKLDATKQDHARRVEVLQDAQLLSLRKAAAIQANVERIEEAMDAVAGLLQQGMDWEVVGKLIEREQKAGNPVAEIIKLPLKLADNTITLVVGEQEEDEDEGISVDYDSDSDSSVSHIGDAQPAKDKRLEVDINLGLSPWANAREYYDHKRTAAVKEQKTVEQSEMALENAGRKIAQDLKKGLKQEKPVLQPIRKQMWFEKFLWFISSDGYLVLAGRDASQNELLYRRHLRKGDVYVHADLHGAPSVIVKNDPKAPDAPIPPSTLSQAGNLAVCSTSAWDSKAGMGAYWVGADQVSKSAPTGEFLPTGSFMVRGKKNFLPPAQLLLGFGLLFRISDDSMANHVKHRIYHGDVTGTVEPKHPGDAEAEEAKKQDEDERADLSDGQDDIDDLETMQRPNPLLQPGGGLEMGHHDDDDDDDDVGGADDDAATEDNQEEKSTPPLSSADVARLKLEDELATATARDTKPEEPLGGQDEDPSLPDGELEEADDVMSVMIATTTMSRAQTGKSQGKGPLKRGQRGKVKKMATKYKDRDEEDRAAFEAVVGSTAGRQKAEAEAKAKAESEAVRAAQQERRQAQLQRQQQEAKAHEEMRRRRLMRDEGGGVEGDDNDDDELAEEERMAAMSSTPLDALVGTPLAGDEILEAIPVCAPWTALAKVKYKAKLQPGGLKKGKAVREVIERWKADSTKKGALDEAARDTERMWPREVDLIRALKPEESINCVPVGKVKVMMAGGGGGGGSGGQSKGGGKGGGGGGGKNKKK